MSLEEHKCHCQVIQSEGWLEVVWTCHSTMNLFL